MRYGRDADALLLGYAGPRAEATAIQEQSAAFWGTPRHLPLSADKTLSTHAGTGRARVLGDAIGMRNSHTQCDQARRRAVLAKLGLSIPEDGLENKRQRDLRAGKAHHRAARMNESA